MTDKLKVVELQPDKRIDEAREFLSDLFNSVRDEEVVEVVVLCAGRDGTTAGWCGVQDRYRLIGMLEDLKAQLLEGGG